MSPRSFRLWNRLRYLTPGRWRWFFEGSPRVPGQLWVAERRLLYDVVRAARPQIAIESGTWLGGGSTLFIAQALHDNKSGVLHTCESDSQFFQRAQNGYKRHLPQLTPFVHFHAGSSREVYPRLLATLNHIDFLLLDGAEDALETMREFEMFAPYLQRGALLAAHDWNSDKTRLLRPFLENSPQWRIKTVLQPPLSLGFALCEKIA